MKIPKYIQDKMSKAARLHNEANTLMEEVYSFFEKKSIDLDSTRLLKSVDGSRFPDYIDHIENGEDVVEDFIEFLENYY